MVTRFHGWLLATCLWLASGCALGADEWLYSVRPGDTLWSLSHRYLTDPTLLEPLRALNGVKNPRRLPPGMQLRIPYDWIRATPASVRVLAVRGAVQVEDGSGSRAVQPQDEVRAGEVLTTPSDGHVVLQFQDGSRLSLLADSVLRIVVSRAYASGVNEARVELLRGRTENQVVPRTGQGVRFEILTPAGVTSVRGTDYRVSAEVSSTARTEVLEGAVAVDGTGGGVRVPAGFGTLVVVGEAPRAPVALLPAPDLTALPARVESLPAELDLAPVHGARAYRVQLARDAAFESIVLDVVERAPRANLPLLASGRYVLRVRAVDELGLEGRNAERELELVAAPAPPVATAPESGSAIRADTVTLDWRAAPGQVHRVQVARDAGFAELVRDISGVAQPPFVLAPGLPAGEYHWRVAAQDPERGDGPFGPGRSFRRLPAAPQRLDATLDPAAMRLAWASAEPQARFRVQLARDAAFSDLLLDRVVDDAPLDLERPAPGRYRVRVLAVGADGVEGAPSSTLDVDVPPPPAPPVLLQPAQAHVARAFPLTLAWEAQPDVRYEVRVTGDGSDTPVRAGDITGGEMRLEAPLPPGTYAWSVAASTAQDGRGPFSPAQRLHVPPPAPVLAAPEVDAKSLRLTWTTPVSAPAYRVQLARDAQFNDVIADAQVSQTQWSTTALAPATYHARVQAVGPDAIASEFSSAQAVEVRRRFPWWVLPIVPLLLLLP